MRLTAIEQELVGPEIGVFARAIRDPAVRERYTELEAAVESGEIEEDLLPYLGAVLEIALESGRLRRVYGADGEQALSRLYTRTPAGSELAASARAVSASLQGLQGQTLEEVKVSPLGPSAYEITIDTDRGQTVLRLERGSARVHQIAIGI